MNTVIQEHHPRSMRRMFVAAGATALLAGCLGSTSIPGGPAAWSQVEMRDTTVMPNLTADPSRRTRVVVLASDESPAARGAGLAEVATASLNTMLGAGGVEVVERGLATRLDQELKLAEMRGSGSYGGPEVADYAIRVVMGTAGWSSNFVQASNFKNPLTGKMVHVPAGYTHMGQSTMTVRIYALPSLRMVGSFPIEGKSSVAQQPFPAGPQQAHGLMRSATDGGVKGKQSEVLNEFAPRGYISERRVKEKKSILRAMLGKQTGAKPGDKVQITTLQGVKDLNGRESFDEVPVTEGVVSDIVSESGSWLIVDDEKGAAAVRRGDIVRVKRGDCRLAEWRECLAKVKP